jgi:uncharacterized protein YbaA (DUF1428 family)
MSYIDVYVLPVSPADLETYFTIARKTAPLWLEHGALAVTEARGEDTPMGEITSFPRSVQVKDDEVVICGFVTFRDRAHRDEVNAKVMTDPRMNDAMRDAPVDGKRMIWGGFAVEISV